MGFPAEGLALKILQPGIYSFSRHIRFFSYGCVLSGIFGVFPMYLRAFHLSAIGYAEEFFFSLKDFEVSILQPNADEQSVCGEAETSEGKISVLLCVYKETGETTGRINKSS